jgi:hypothetical protein
MNGAAHFALGATIGVASRNPWIGVPLAFATHYCFDAIPHSEYIPANPVETRGKKSASAVTKMFLDLATGVIVVSWLTHFNTMALLAGFVAVIPDGLSGLAFVLTKRGTIVPSSRFVRALAAQRRFHKRVHWKKRPYDASLIQTIAFQAIPAFAILFFVTEIFKR